MAPIDKEELAKLPPEERLRKLKEFKKKEEGELRVVDELIKKTEEELKAPPKEFSVPEVAQVDIASLFAAEHSLEGSVSSHAGKGSTLVKSVKYERHSTEDYKWSQFPEEVVVPKVEIQLDYRRDDKDVVKSVGSKTQLDHMLKYQRG